MKILIAYYSRTGMTKNVALKLAAELGANNNLKVDVEEIVDKDKRAGALGYLMAGRDALQKKPAAIEPLRYNPADYDLVLVGTPTWAYAMSCAVRAYLTSNKDEIKKVAFFVTHGSDGGDKAVKQMADFIALKPVAELVLTSKEAAQDKYGEKLKEFISNLI